VASSTATDYYALRLRRLAGTDVPKIDSIKVSPESVVQGAAVCEIPVPTITWTNGAGLTATTTGLKAYRVGSRMNLRGYISFTGVGSDAGALGMSLTGYSWGTTNQDAGWIRVTQYSTVYAYTFFVYKESSTLLNFYTQNLDVAAASTTLKGTTISSSTSGEYNSFYVDIWLDITTWDDGVTMANRAVEEYASNSDTSTSDATASTSVAGIAGSAIGSFTSNTTGVTTKTVRFSTPIQKTDSIIVEVNSSPATKGWVPASSIYPWTLQSTRRYGIAYNVTNSTDIDVYFGKAGSVSNGAAYTNDGATWASESGTYWRVRKVSGGASVGYPISTANIVGRTDGSTVGSGYIGEMLESGVTAVTAATSWATASSISITLTPGVWLMSASISAVGNSGTATYMRGYLGTTQMTSGTAAPTGTTAGKDALYRAMTDSSDVGGITFPNKYVNISSTTTYYLGALSDYTTASSTLMYVNAVRIA
jgi:hypothetical protein